MGSPASLCAAHGTAPGGCAGSERLDSVGTLVNVMRDTWFMAWLYQRMLLKEKREPLSKEFENVLRDYFAADQVKLRQLLDSATSKRAA